MYQNFENFKKLQSFELSSSIRLGLNIILNTKSSNNTNNCNFKIISSQ